VLRGQLDATVKDLVALRLHKTAFAPLEGAEMEKAEPL